MVKRFLFLISFCLIISCFPTKNEFNQERFKVSRYKIKPKENISAYKIVDTSSLYVLVNIYNNGNELNFNNEALKFYDNGKIGKFKDFDFKDKSLINPQKAKMGYYKYDNNELEIEFYSHSAQNGNFLVRESVVVKKDTLVTSYGNFKYKYVKIKLPKEFLIYKPDW